MERGDMERKENMGKGEDTGRGKMEGGEARDVVRPRHVVLFSDENLWKNFEDYVRSIEGSLDRLGRTHERVLWTCATRWDLWMARRRREKFVCVFLQSVPDMVLWLLDHGNQRARGGARRRARAQRQHMRSPAVAVVNTEQCSRAEVRQRCREYLRRGLLLLDYSRANMRLLQEADGLCGDQAEAGKTGRAAGAASVLWLPFQHIPESAVAYDPRCPKSVDAVQVNVYAVGMQPGDDPPAHRPAQQQALQARGVRAENVVGWGAERDCRIAQARVLVNVHYSERYRVFEHMRCDRWIFARMLVVSKPCVYPEDVDVAPFVCWAPSDAALAETVALLLWRG